jgi:hypothetical protein
MEFTRREQLDATAAALKRHADLGKLLHTAVQTYSAQSNHLEGLYNEVDKLTKGKSLVPTSDLLIDLVNSLISDAKELVCRDTYLDRLKTFVSAGDNPNYPDVLVALRILRQGLQRFNSLLETETDMHAGIGTELKTILSALQVAERDERDFDKNNDSDSTETEGDSDDTQEQDEEEVDDDSEADDDGEEGDGDYEEDDDSEQAEEYHEYVRKQEVRARLNGGAISEAWFRDRGGEALFNFAELDRRGIPTYEPPSEGITFIKCEK